MAMADKCGDGGDSDEDDGYGDGDGDGDSDGDSQCRFDSEKKNLVKFFFFV